jgi:GNAT superfamily N-acetyltransferase
MRDDLRLTRTDIHGEPGAAGFRAPDSAGETVRKATAADVPRLSVAMARAFQDDPVTTWMMPDAGRRRRGLESGFALLLRRIYLQHDECYTTEGIFGGALWLPPNQWKLGPIAQLGLLPRMLLIWGRDMPRAFTFLNFLEARHPHDEHHYLFAIGVEPQWRGKGIGTLLMRPILGRCDREGVAAYLEATSARSRDLYLRNGFDVIQEVMVPRGGPPLWLMRREPRRPPS